MRLVIYTNILTPYRKYFFDVLNEFCKERNIFFKVLVMSKTEPDRNWNYDDLKGDYTILLEGKTISVKGIYIHINKNLKNTIEGLRPTHVVCAGSYLCPGVYKLSKLKEKFNYIIYFWSESHLNEDKNNGFLKKNISCCIKNKIYKKFDGFWYAGEFSLDFIKKYAKDNFKKIYVPNLVDYHIFDYHLYNQNDKQKIKEEFDIKDDKILFICPARLTYVKGIDKFLDLISMSKYKKRISIIIPGEGELTEIIMEKAKQYDIDIKILGYLEQSVVAKLYSISDFFLMPSRSDPNPLTCIEALWAGLPLIVSEHVGNHKEVIQQLVNGFVFSYSNTESIENIFKNIINWTDIQYKNAKNTSYQLAKNNYMTEDVIKRIYEEMKKD
ncbi:glycosyltransferase family 4 protein [Thomasclavelia sp.]|uniref:glycosyltransferase family 4 protein n=1 Tax=Thomasclavelia sp. TaxID=3025757 RepID=UPI00260FE62F|nr:glycosyltransferase [Thomasclavelia sp.]